MATSECPLCGVRASTTDLARASWLAAETQSRLARAHPEWQRGDGACPACVQWALLQTLLERGEAALHEGIQSVWPLDAQAAFGALPTPLRMRADPRYTARGVTLAMVDSSFYPHPDLTQPHNRIKAWVDATRPRMRARYFTANETPRWPGWDAAAPAQWHGLMTSCAAAGNGWLSNGLYRGLASSADLVLVKTRGDDGRIPDVTIARALNWLAKKAAALGVRVVSLSVAGDLESAPADNEVDRAVARLVDQGITVVAAAGNDGQRRLVPPATAPQALTIGGLDDKNTFDHAEMEIWHSNYGQSTNGTSKPELVAPSLWVVAPVLPGTQVATEAVRLFEARAAARAASEPAERDATTDQGITQLKLVTPYYQHVEGTSFAAPIVASVVACMLEANPSLTPAQVRDVLIRASRPVAGAAAERQGAGALEAGQAIALALREMRQTLPAPAPVVMESLSGVIFTLHEQNAQQVQVIGSWDNWSFPGVSASLVAPGVWRAEVPAVMPGRYLYKFLLDGARWKDDPVNPNKAPDGAGGLNSVLTL